MADPVTVVVTRRLLPGRGAGFAAWFESLAEAAGAIPGYRGTTVLAGGETRHIIERFADDASLAEWEASPDRARLIAQANEFSTVERQSLTGLETWFEIPALRRNGKWP